MKIERIKSWLSLGVLALSLSLVSCSTDWITNGDDGKTGNSDDRTMIKMVTVKAGETFLLEDASLEITFAEILEDSRCPMSVVCFTEGNAKIRVNLKSESESKEVIFNTNRHSGDLKTDFNGKTITLVKLSPYPEVPEDAMNMEYVATFSIN